MLVFWSACVAPTSCTFLMPTIHGSRVLNILVSRLLAGSGCHKLLAGDGITTAELSIRGLQGIFDSISVDARLIRKSIPAIGETSSIAKNLDEYQFLICSLIPSLPDSNPLKLQLQKYRVAITASFAKLVSALKEIRQDDLVQWNRHAKSLLEETSEAYVKAKSNSKLQVTSHREAFEFFEVPEDKIDAALRILYGQNEG
jgi:hypothetical protein